MLFFGKLLVITAVLHVTNSFELNIIPCRGVRIFAGARSPENGVSLTYTRLYAQKNKTQKKALEDTTEKYGLEAGIFQSFQSDDAGKSAKELIAKYGVAYLATSIPLAAISFVLCYLLVDNGVDVAGLLKKVGILVNEGEAGEKVGTVAIAYAAHKAASPIRFPPTVILTPVVAKIIGKEPSEDHIPK